MHSILARFLEDVCALPSTLMIELVGGILVVIIHRKFHKNPSELFELSCRDTQGQRKINSFNFVGGGDTDCVCLFH